MIITEKKYRSLAEKIRDKILESDPDRYSGELEIAGYALGYLDCITDQGIALNTRTTEIYQDLVEIRECLKDDGRWR